MPGFEILYKKHTKNGQVQQVLVKIDLFGGLSYLVINYIAYEAEAGKSQAVDNGTSVLRTLEPDEREKRKLAAEMAATDMFAEFTSDDLSIISGYAGICDAPAGAVVLREGESSPKLCLILDGTINIVKGLAEGGGSVVATLSTGKTLGEMSLMDGMPYSASAVADRDTRLAVFEQQPLNELAQTHPALYTRIIGELTRQISTRLRTTTDLLANHLSKSAELTGALNEALRAARSRGTFAIDMSHQMRTPLNAITGYVELLGDDIDSGDAAAAREDIARIREACEVMTRLVTDILDLSKIEAGRVALQLEEIGIRYLLDELATSMEPVVARRKNTLNIDCPPDIGTMKSDEIQLRQVLVNLLENAAQHTREGVITLGARAVANDAGDWVVFTVTDTGQGMSAEQLGKLFARFSDSDSSVRAKYGGTGLGLAISQSLCRMFGGDIAVDSERGVGTVFTVRLPRVPPLDQ